MGKLIKLFVAGFLIWYGRDIILLKKLSSRGGMEIMLSSPVAYWSIGLFLIIFGFIIIYATLKRESHTK